MIDDQGRYFPSHLSPSQLTLYSLCPTLYRERYVLNLFPPPQPERLFGVAVHAGLEAQFRGEDDELAFIRQWNSFQATLDRDLYPLLPALRTRGLDILSMVRDLHLEGEPEKLVSVTWPEIKIPIVGYVDLWSEATHTIYDFKTTGFSWPQARADAQVFQPAVYSQAFVDAHLDDSEDLVIPQFKFVVLPRVPGPVSVVDGTRSYEQISQAWELAVRIHRAIEAQEWGCTCRGRYHLFSDGWSDFEDEAGEGLRAA